MGGVLTTDHAPRRGPLYWDYRCLRCGEPVANHAPWWTLLLRKLWDKRANVRRGRNTESALRAVNRQREAEGYPPAKNLLEGIVWSRRRDVAQDWLNRQAVFEELEKACEKGGWKEGAAAMRMAAFLHGRVIPGVFEGERS